MSSGLPSASQLERAFRCTGSCVLPRAESTTVYAQRGVDVHAYLRDVNVLGSTAALAAIADEDVRAVCREIDLDRLPVDPSRYAAEVALAWDVVTGIGRELGRDMGRDYSSATPTEMVGTADLIGLVGDDRLIVADWKTGRGEMPGPGAHRQLRLLALAACRAYGRTAAIVELVRLREDGTAWRERAELDLFDLAEIAEELRGLAHDIAAARRLEVPPLRLGAWCRGCNSIRFCPAQWQLGRALVVAPDVELAVVSGALTSPQHARAAYEKLAAAEAIMNEMRAIVDDYAATYGIDVGDGKVYGLVKSNRESLDGQATWHLLKERHGEEAAWAAVTLKATKTAIEDLAAKLAAEDRARAEREGDGAAPGRKKTHIAREIIDELRARGAVHAKPIESIRVHKPKDAR